MKCGKRMTACLMVLLLLFSCTPIASAYWHMCILPYQHYSTKTVNKYLPLIYATPEKLHDFGGETYTLSTFIDTPENRAMIEDFEKHFNVNIEITVKDEYNQFDDIEKKRKDGDPYDVVQMIPSRFQWYVGKACVQPIGNLVTKSDFYSSGTPYTGGFTDGHSDRFCLNGYLYSVGGLNDGNFVGIWYNKTMLEAASCEDLLTLYNKGKLTWEEIYKIGCAVTNEQEQVYMLPAFQNHADFFAHTYDTDFIRSSAKGAAEPNSSDKKLFEALKMFEWLAGIIDRTPKADEKDGRDAFLAGTTCTYFGTPEEWQSLQGSVGDAFDNNEQNLGWVPLPKSPYGYNVKQISYAYGIGYGSDNPLVGLCLAYWETLYRSSQTSQMPEWLTDLDKSLRQNNRFYIPSIGFSTFAGSLDSVRNNIYRAIANGNGYSSTWLSHQKPLKRVLDAAKVSSPTRNLPVQESATVAFLGATFEAPYDTLTMTFRAKAKSLSCAFGGFFYDHKVLELVKTEPAKSGWKSHVDGDFIAVYAETPTNSSKIETVTFSVTFRVLELDPQKSQLDIILYTPQATSLDSRYQASTVECRYNIPPALLTSTSSRPPRTTTTTTTTTKPVSNRTTTSTSTVVGNDVTTTEDVTTIPTETTTTVSDTPTDVIPKPEPPFPWWWVATGASILTIGGVLLFVFLKKKT